MTVIELKTDSGKWITPWGHEFGTKKELEAFIEGMKYVASNVTIHANVLLEKVDYSENVKGE